MVAYKRIETLGGRYNMEQFRNDTTSRLSPFKDFVEDQAGRDEWVTDNNGKIWRGGAQRAKALMAYMVPNPDDVLVDFTAGTGVLLDAASSLGMRWAWRLKPICATKF
ncbi:hypothetical protein O6H91_02G023800 [Diphasiastrum complanatum]|uniref:Uncharacterized protein n=1 Tax=Diphasiastrum complanatum TaxID=34168 RepID=A0ACC2EDT7_DIPCM|nr:hypothetical protein O6H91_02G023800 [Diphasiastrum complanatum]